MQATFPLRKSFILQGGILASLFFIILVVSTVVPLLFPDPDLDRMPRFIISLLAAVPWLGMFLLANYILLAGLRVKVVVQGDRVSDIGVFQRKEFALAEVTAAQWQFRGRKMRRPRLQVNTPVGWVPFDFRVHRTADARQLIQFFRSGLSPEIQEGWTPEWEELAVSLDVTRSDRDPLTWSKFVLACWLAGIGAGLICGVIAHFMLSGLPVVPYSWSGSYFVDWMVYGVALGSAFSVLMAVSGLTSSCGHWLDR